MIYAIYSQKGGIGKSTTTYNLGCGLAGKGKKVLLVDLDQQSNLSLMAGVDEVKHSLVDVFGGVSVSDAVVECSGVDLLCATDEIMEYKGSADSLKKALQKIKKYDYILLDCPPGVSGITKNALLAADRVIIPVNLDLLGLQSLKQVKGFIDGAKQINKKLVVSGILVTRYVERLQVSKKTLELLGDAAKYLNCKIYKTYIRECVALREEQYFEQSIFDYAAKSAGAEDFASLTNEIIKER